MQDNSKTILSYRFPLKAAPENCAIYFAEPEPKSVFPVAVIVSFPLANLKLAFKRIVTTGLECDFIRAFVPQRLLPHLLSTLTRRFSDDESSLSTRFLCEESEVNDPVYMAPESPCILHLRPVRSVILKGP